MKHLHALFIYLSALLLTATGIQDAKAQATQARVSKTKAVQDALYIHRNDNGFHGFFFDDILRFEYSKTDTLGVEHDDYVVQEVVTVDSVYRIPLSAIDSIAFVTPETVYKSDVAHTSESQLWDYVIARDSLQLTLALNTPAAIVPKVGDKLVTENATEVLPGGFIGQVDKVQTSGNGIVVDCEFIDLDAVFDQYVGKIRMDNVDAESANATDASRAPRKASLNELPTRTFDHTIDLLSPGVVGQVGGSASLLATGKVAKVHAKMTMKQWLRLFTKLEWTGLYRDFTCRSENDLEITTTINAALTGRVDLGPPAVLLAPLPIGLELWGGVGFTLSATGSTVFDSKYHSHFVFVQNVQCNGSLANLDGFTNQSNPFQLISYEDEYTSGKTSGAGSIQMGLFVSPSVRSLAGTFNFLSLRFEGGLKCSLSAEVKEDDLTQTLPGLFSSDVIKRRLSLYDVLKHEGCVSIQPYVSGKTLLGVGISGLSGLYASGEVSFDLDKLRAWYPNAFSTYGWKIAGALAPSFHNTALSFSQATPKASTDINGHVIVSTPVGFAAYYEKSGKMAGQPVWNGQRYNAYHEWEKDKYTNINNYELELPSLGGGKRVSVYPTFKLAGYDYEMIGSPVATATVPVKIFSIPDELTFEPEGGKLSFRLTDNLDRKEDTFVTTYGVTLKKEDGDWLSVKETGGGYEVTAQPYTGSTGREGTVDVEITNTDDVTATISVPVTQKAAEAEPAEFTAGPDPISVSGYSTDFKNGLLTQVINVTYPKTAKEVKVVSSDNSWLKIDKDWASQEESGNSIKATRNISITPNLSLTTPRSGTITIEATMADGKPDRRTISVAQTALVIDVKLEPDKVTLLARESADSKYSDTQKVAIKITPWDDIVATAVKKQDVTTDAQWITATREGQTISVRGDANPMNEDRKNTVVYTLTPTTGDPIVRTLTVIQKALEETTVCDDYTPKSLRLPAKGGELTVTFNCDNIDRIVDFVSYASWLEGGGSGKSITLVAPSANPYETERSGNFQVTFLMKNGTRQSQIYTAYQEAGVADGNPFVSSTIVKVPSAGASTFFSYNPGNFSYTGLRVPQSNWFKATGGADYQSPTRYPNEIYVTVAPNLTSEVRKDTIFMAWTNDTSIPFEDRYIIEVVIEQEAGPAEMEDLDYLLFGTWENESADNLLTQQTVFTFNSDGTYRYDRVRTPAPGSTRTYYSNMEVGTYKVTGYELDKQLIRLNVKVDYDNTTYQVQDPANTSEHSHGSKTISIDVFPHFNRYLQYFLEKK